MRPMRPLGIAWEGVLNCPARSIAFQPSRFSGSGNAFSMQRKVPTCLFQMANRPSFPGSNLYPVNFEGIYESAGFARL
jgi:hypothetical protein